MTENGRHSRVGHVIGWHVDCLHRGDGTIISGVDTILQFGHLGAQGRLITNRGRHTPQQAGYFTTGLDKAKHVIHQQKNILDATGLAYGEHGWHAKHLKPDHIENLNKWITAELIDLETGAVNTEINIDNYDMQEASQREATSIPIVDLAGADWDAIRRYHEEQLAREANERYEREAEAERRRYHESDGTTT